MLIILPYPRQREVRSTDMLGLCGQEEGRRAMGSVGAEDHRHWPEATGTLTPVRAPPCPGSQLSFVGPLCSVLLRGQQGRKDKDKASCSGLSG